MTSNPKSTRSSILPLYYGKKQQLRPRFFLYLLARKQYTGGQLPSSWSSITLATSCIYLVSITAVIRHKEKPANLLTAGHTDITHTLSRTRIQS